MKKKPTKAVTKAAAAKTPKQLGNPRKIPSLSYSTRNKSEKAYATRARELSKKFGVKFGFDLRKKLTGGAKSAVTKATDRLKIYLNPDNRFKFVPVKDAKKLRAVKRNGSDKLATTAGGVFVQIPKAKNFISASGRVGKLKGKTRIRITKTGEIEKKTGKRTSTHKLYSSKRIVRDPAAILRDAKKRGASHVLVSIKGCAGTRLHSVADFYTYIADVLSPDIEEQIESGEGAFQNYFGVEFVTFEK